jgi:hypothetical protein
MQDDDAYWALDLPGLTESDAASLVDFAQRRLGLPAASVVDPGKWLTTHQDIDTVAILVTGLEAGIDSTQLDPDMSQAISSLLGEFQSWLHARSRGRGRDPESYS